MRPGRSTAVADEPALRGAWSRRGRRLAVISGALLLAVSAAYAGATGVASVDATDPVLPTPVEPEPVATPEPPGGAVLDRRVAATLDPVLANTRLGGHVVAAVADLDAAVPALVTEVRAGAAVDGPGQVIPASLLKLLTGVAALESLGPGHVFTTRVVARGGRKRIVLVGGGDPYLARKPVGRRQRATVYPPRADLRTLARDSARSLQAAGVSRVRVDFDDSLFSGPTASAGWPASYLAEGVVSPITALWVDGGRDPGGIGRVADPTARAVQVFRTALGRAGISVTGSARRRPVPAEAAGVDVVARADSAPLSQIVERLLTVSDNEAAEVVAHHVGLEVAGDASFEGGAIGTATTLNGLGVDLDGAQLDDGSGLSRGNRLDVETLIAVLRVAASPEHPELRAVLSGLPVGGFNGSLQDRFDSATPAQQGRVRAKTGTLTGVSGLAGLVTDAGGNTLAVVLAADQVRLSDTLATRAALDRAAASLASCRCSR